MLNKSIRSLAVVAMIAAIGACKKKEVTQTGGPGDTMTAAVPPAPPSTPLAVANVDLGKSIDAEKKVPNPTATFAPKDTIYAAVATTGTGTNATLAAKWIFKDTQTVDSTALTISPTGPSQNEFHVSKPTGWPVGKYKVVIFLDGRQVSEKDFEVKK